MKPSAILADQVRLSWENITPLVNMIKQFNCKLISKLEKRKIRAHLNNFAFRIQTANIVWINADFERGRK